MSGFDEKYCIESFEKLLETDSTTGMYEKIQRQIIEMIEELGYSYETTHKGGVIADLGGEGNPLVVTAHLDSIGLMVRHINSDGTLNVCPIGGLFPFYCVTENVRVHTRDGKIYTGIVCRIPNSLHVTEEELTTVLPDFRKNVCVILDEDVKSSEDVRKLGIESGDYIGLEPRFRVENGYLKTRFVDDKACAAVLLSVMKQIKDSGMKLKRKVYAYFAMYEEIGHGTAYLPEGVNDVLALDIAPLGPEQNSDEKKVSIFAKDAEFIYHDAFTNELRDCAGKAKIDYVMDVFTPHYSSDGDGSIKAGYDVRHAAIGPGTLNSHGYERTHIDGLRNTYLLLMEYLKK
jgi:putative aminopeptidase FrvX